ncbi:MAG: UDP-glucose/GDP-mannose dehydrogenase family protein [Candidatus Stahlbacteria bacterium]|nr:UDP-glucose/GDP-mannose dehydrogenase family protein [Candidatus Stahlbacteria bacterium]
MKIAIIGTGHVGLITGVCFAELGNEVTCIDADEVKIQNLKKGLLPIYEPGLQELLAKNTVNTGHMSQGLISLRLKSPFYPIKFTTSIKDGTKDAIVIFICVGTPPKSSGEADLSAVENVTMQIAESMSDYKLVVEKSTVPVRTGIRIKQLMEQRAKTKFDVASNPEFLREGNAIYDFMHPDRIVIGVESERAKNILLELYQPIKAPIVVTDIESAELIKHASNSFLATKISFINAVALICEKTGANIEQVAQGIGLDHRIGKDFLNAGIGFGGFCFPKDLRAFRRIAEKIGTDFNLLKEVENINEEMKKRFISKIEDSLWNLKDKVIGVLGLAFKPDTEDMRYAPSIDIIKTLQEEGAKIKVYDPQAMNVAKSILKDVEYCSNPYQVAEGSDCLCILTEWDEFKELDLIKIKKLLKSPIIIDGRNIFSKQEMQKMGFKYKSIGR